jgi:hypothetical protein
VPRLPVLRVQTSPREEYYNYVRRLPPKPACEVIFKYFFPGCNDVYALLSEAFFKEQYNRWMTLAHDILPKKGARHLPDDIRCFPALLFQVIAVTLQFISDLHEPLLDELRYGSQTFAELSREYSDCGVALAEICNRLKLTFIGVQHNFMRGFWLRNSGNIIGAWNHSGETVR